MTKFVRPEGAAYEIAPGVTREEAAELGLTMVEQNYGTTPPTPIFGRYLDAPKGSGLGVTVQQPSDTRIVGGGSLGADPAAGPDKGVVMKPESPIVHNPEPDTSIHEDGAEPGVTGEPDVPQEPKAKRK